MDEYVKISEVMDAIDEQIVRLNDSDRHCVTTAKINVMAIRKRVRDLPTIWVQMTGMIRNAPGRKFKM